MIDIGKVISQRSASDDSHYIGVNFSLTASTDALLLRDVFSRIAEKIADQWVADHYQEVVALIRPEAIATLTVADAATAINKTLKEELPQRTRDVVRREAEVYQRGILGGIKRIR